MKQLIYALQFRGEALPVAQSPNVVNVKATTSSSQITTNVGAQGVRTIHQAPGPAANGQATVEAQVRLTGENAFHETGTVTFGAGGHRVRFSTLGQGYIGPSADPALRHGSVIWKVDGGEGQFEGASGLITANFTVGNAGELTVNQFGVIFAPSEAGTMER
ncbi:MAG: hypothetical protein ACRDJN_13155 [Chloroflexota bacterium]